MQESTPIGVLWHFRKRPPNYGTLGTGPLQNDTTAYIWVEFEELYKKGVAPKELGVKLEKRYRPQSYTEFYAEIWTGIA